MPVRSYRVAGPLDLRRTLAPLAREISGIRAPRYGPRLSLRRIEES